MTSELAEFASAVAPHLDRLRLGVMRASVERGMASGFVADSGLEPDVFTVFAMLRNAYPDREVPLESYRAAYVYQGPTKFEAALARMVAVGLVEVVPSGLVVLSSSGRDLMALVRAVGAQAAEGLWGTGEIPALVLADRSLVTASMTAVPGGAFHLVSPPHDDPSDSDAVRLAERLTGLRYHRFDAHVAAWRSAGLTAASVADLGPGPIRDEIEKATNESAGAAYASLSTEERAELLGGLAALA